MLEISLLGPMEVRVDGQAVDIPGDIARRILAGLATEQPVTTDRLIDIAWGSDPPRSARSALQTQISRLRGRLGRGSIVGSGTGYSIADASVDVERLHELLDRDRPESLQEAVDLVRGEPLADLTSCEELTGTRRALTELVNAARLRRAHGLIDEGRSGDAIPALERLIASSPLLEPAWLALARATHAAGRQADAISVIDRYRSTLADAGLEPSPALSIVEDEVFAAPTRLPADRRRKGVVERRSSFIGRDSQLESLCALFSTERLVTVIGPGGMGKTRLAEAAGLRMSPQLPGGVVEVELGSDTSGSEVPTTIARAVGVRAGDDAIEAVASSIGGARTLVLIDNCEHLIDSVRESVARLLDASPQTLVLATSRQPLGVDGEALFALEPLNPDAEGVRLFLERARTAGAAIEVSDRPDIERLCRRLDGMPLAIEMAAARSRSVTPAELLSLLDESQAVLESSLPAERHQTLDALVEWSYSRLAEEEQRVFRSLGVFAGGFEAIDAAHVLEQNLGETLLILARLVERSLCQSTRRGGATEFRLLETLRMAARDRLTSSGEAAHVMRAHGEWAAGLAMEAASTIDHRNEAAMVDRLVRAIPDVIVAHQRAIDTADEDLQIRLLGPLFPFVYLVMPPGLAEPARRSLDGVERTDHPFLPWLDAVAAAYELAAGRPESAGEHLQRARTRPLGQAAWPAWFMSTDLAVYQGALDEAERSNRHVIRLAEDPDSELRPSGWTDGLITEALVACYSGRTEDAVVAATHALRRAHVHGAPSYVAFAEYAMGEVHQDLDPVLALEHLHRAAELSQDTGTPFVEGIARTTIASVLARTGRHTESLTEFRRLIEHLERSGARVHLWTALRNLIVLLGEVEAWGDVARLLGATDDRVRPTYGDEAKRLALTTRRARIEAAEFESLHQHGRSVPIAEVGSLAKSMIDSVIG